ncbi:UDP-N-acetylglucosamine-N-acetylmuramylpentapeptide N-acetylglucosamine transferase [Muriicola jejuensis]|uniref:UDP-N-acetylglucosamine--N-acetylmuramyl-(pentapeptide) pyrophosphoryl-undecaprenol N-acetylglucosamine transferase n=1 Tax=Muriicola jejuensis TaxID=504488 RepID=A0A6P0U8D3_9FLAO|nr:undecaprenyldiphospho-muramoylpentapeptide beta-N-acetylglucosaminyltransferase [Muriicola jejuensis]NER09334.1 undecaprenyldiphospho-muramoylpentapeptide beta-N-acetylglucosaminyltransferase [Muriicola jejuensis]SMP09239.1 UDP-N-acetylglucosamine-N-acetylmuramylpentapeptide N-acetylglucosamine transferase [Muriicola jejuensis]
MGSYRIILSGGGTGGHIYPAISIANEFKRRFPDAEILFVGAQDRMEMEKVPQAGYEIKGLWISGLQRKLSVKNLLFPIKVISSLIRARNIVRKFNPDVVVGTGGFASGPVLQVASRKGVPCLLQEQNSYAGITNKWLSGKVDRICVAYGGMEKFFPKEKIVFTGNPVRAALVNLPEDAKGSYEFFDLLPEKMTLLVLGGSLGSRRINQLIESQLPFFKASGLQLVWQCGSGYYEQYKHLNSDTVKVFGYLNHMEHGYRIADIIISRSGAGSVSELCMVGKPVMFIPSPNVAEDHQTKNALALVKQQAALMIREEELDAEFKPAFEELLNSGEKRAELGRNIKSLAKPGATESIVDEIVELLNNRHG